MLKGQILAACLMMSSNQNQVPVDALLAIMEVEGGRTGCERKNENGTHDLGLMQINSCWIPKLSKAWSVAPAHARKLIRDNDCLNISVAGHILKTKIREGRGDLLEGIARYNSANPKYGRPYLKKVVAAYFRQKNRGPSRQRTKQS